MLVLDVADKPQSSKKNSVLLKRELELELAIEKKRCFDYKYFFRPAWYVIEPATPLKWNWHIDVLCDELQKQAERIARREKKEYDLIINIPPRSLKSTIVSRLFIPYVWTRFPGQKFLTSSYSGALALEHSVDSRTLIQSTWYQRHWGENVELVSDQNVKGYYRTNQAGYRISTSVGATATGRGGDWIIVDDPLSADQADSELLRLSCVNWWNQTMYTRLNDPEVGIRVIIMQRLHEDDLTGYVLKTAAATYKLYCLPAIDTDYVSPPELRKQYKNKLFFPARFNHEYLTDARVSMREYSFAGQMLQLPSPPEGGMFKRHWWKFWRLPGQTLPAVEIKVGTEAKTCPVVDLPTSFEDQICSWDMALKDRKENDYLSGQVWARSGANFYLLDQTRGHYNSLEAADQAKQLKQNYPRSSQILIEDEAAGSYAILDLQRTIPGVLGIIPHGPKKARAIPMSRLAESGNIILPHPALCSWVNSFIDEFAGFDTASHDDQVDAGSQAINYFLKTKRVWQEYQGQHASFVINFSELSPTTVLCMSQWVERNLKSSLIMGLWQGRQGKLYVFDELLTDTPQPETVITRLLAQLRMNCDLPNIKPEYLKQFQWFGNSLMFAKGIGDVQDAYTKHRINLRMMDLYDEPGAIVRTSRYLLLKSLIVHTRCQILRGQMAEWSIEDDKPEDSHGFCRALCQMIAALYEAGKLTAPKPPPKPYSRARTAQLELVDKAAAEGRYIDTITGKRPGEKQGWII